MEEDTRALKQDAQPTSTNQHATEITSHGQPSNEIKQEQDRLSECVDSQIEIHHDVKTRS